MKKHFCAGIIAVWLAVLCLACSAFAESRLMVVSDLHYLDPSLYPDRPLLLQVL